MMGSSESFENAFSSKTVLSMKESGMCRQENEMVEEYKCGLMAHDMKAIGKMIRLMAEVGSFMLMGMFMRENGRTIRVKDTACICILTVLSTRENGSRINRKGMDLKHGQMAPNTKVGTRMV